MNEAGVARPRKKPFLPRSVKFLLILVGTFFFLAAGAWVLLDITTRQDVERMREEWRALGWPMSREDLSPEPVPEDENAAFTYWRAAEPQSFEPHEATVLADEVRTLTAWRRLSPERRQLLHRWLQNSTEALAVVHEATLERRCDLSVLEKGPPPYPSLYAFAELQRLAVFDAVSEGSADRAFEYWTDSLIMARHQEGQKDVHGEYVRLRCLLSSVDAFEALVECGRPTEEQLAEALKMLEGAQARESFVEGIKSNFVDIEELFALPPKEMVYHHILTGCVRDARQERVFRVYTWPVSRPWRQYDEATILAMTVQLVRMAGQPYHQIHHELERWKQKFGADSYGTRWKPPLATGPSSPGEVRTFARVEARVALARVGAALELYRRSHGSWPRSLSELAPEFLADIPVDPFDGRPLRYVNSDGRIALYSVGRDLQDNDGAETWDSANPWDRWPRDLVFVVRHGPEPPPEGQDSRQEVGYDPLSPWDIMSTARQGRDSGTEKQNGRQ